MDPARFEVAPDPTRLDVDDRAGAKGDGVGGRLRADDRLVEAHGGRESGGEIGVLGEILVLQGLLDEQQAELVQRLQPRQVGLGVGRVGVDLQRDVAELASDRAHRLDVPPGLDLQLDPLVALIEVATDRRHQLVHLRHDADAHPARHAVVHGPEVCREAHVRAAQLGVQDSHLDGRLGHPVTPDGREKVADPGRSEVDPGQPWQQELGDDLIGRGEELR